MKRNKKILALLICILLITLLVVSCKSGEPSGDYSSVITSSEAISEIGSDDNSVTTDESIEASEENPGSPASEEESSDTSTDDSRDVSEESSEDVLTGNISWDEILEKYKDLESIKAFTAVAEKYKDSVHINMKGQVEISGYLFEMNMDMYAEEKSENSLSTSIISGMGQNIMTQKELVLDGVKYGIDDTNRIYCIIPEEESDSFAGLENVEKVVTKNELVKGEIYTTDWFIAKDGSKLGLYTRKSELKYMCMTMDIGNGEKMELLFEISFEEMGKDVKFELPDGYVLVDYESFQGGTSI